MDIETDDSPTEAFDWEAARQQTGASRKQMLFARSYLVNGGNATQAARDAGYSGKTDAGLRSAGHGAKTSPKVLNMLSLAEAHGAGGAETVVDLAEQKRRLSDMIRHGSENGKLAAMRAMREIESLEKPLFNDWDPIETLTRMVEQGPHGAALAFALAKEHFIIWPPWGHQMPDLESFRQRCLQEMAKLPSPEDTAIVTSFKPVADMPSETANEAIRTP